MKTILDIRIDLKVNIKTENIEKFRKILTRFINIKFKKVKNFEIILNYTDK